VEDGPFAIFERARVSLRRASLAGAVDCFYCLSLWVAAPPAFALARSLWEFVIKLFALSAFAILINHLVGLADARAVYFEEPEVKENTPCLAAEMQTVPPSNPPS
jgi:hypothetical protein